MTSSVKTRKSVRPVAAPKPPGRSASRARTPARVATAPFKPSRTGTRLVKSAAIVALPPKKTAARTAPGAKATHKAASSPKLASRAGVTAVKAECTHHWVIEPPNGAVSAGTCRICGERREFRNSYEYSSWYGSKSTPKPGA